MSKRKSSAAGRAKVISSKTVYTGRVFKLVREHIIEPTGVDATRDIIRHPGSVVVLPVFPDGRILMIRQFRQAADQFLWELVAGKKDDGEDFITGAHRELQEETGYTAQRMTNLAKLIPTPGFLSEWMVIFLAEGLQKGKANPEEDEKITQRILTLQDAEKWIRTGKVRDMKSVAAILYYMRFAKRGK